MITTIADLKNRTLAESNIMRSCILTANSNPYRTPKLDDLILHDYQIAHSVTINTISSNFYFDLRLAWHKVYDSDDVYMDSYFQIINNVSEIESLEDTVRMFLLVSDGVGSSYSRRLVYDANQT